MTEGEFLAGITGSDSDLFRAVAALRSSGQPFCLIGGLAVNNYAEPVVTLDADFAVVAAPGLAAALKAQGFEVEEFPHSINARLPGSRLRLQVTINSRYAPFPARAVPGTVFGISMPVASLEDVLQGKVWAFSDETRRASKRAKDRADIIRLCEDHPHLLIRIPLGLVPEVDAMR
jgi:hypothetical protein